MLCGEKMTCSIVWKNPLHNFQGNCIIFPAFVKPFLLYVFKGICYTAHGKDVKASCKKKERRVCTETMNLLSFTVLLLLIFLLILQSNPKNRANQICFVAGCIFACGILKEYLYDQLGPTLIAQGIWTVHFSEMVYSALSVLLYYFALPTVMLFCYYFCGMNLKKQWLFQVLRVVPYFPALVLLWIYPWQNIISEQKDRAFCLVVGCYNVLYATLVSVILGVHLWKNRQKGEFYQRTGSVICMIVLLVFWVLTAFPYHALGLGGLENLWKFNVVIVIAVLGFVIFRLFHGGIWGMRLRLERYNWTDSERTIRRNARYVGHALKNELSKIEWSLQLLGNKGVSAEELEIIRHSAEYLKRFIHETQIYSDSISLKPTWCDVQQLMIEVQEDLKKQNEKAAEVVVCVCDSHPLYCDRIHIQEVLKNLLLNAADAGGNNGRIEVSYIVSRKGNAVISVKDNGRGISAADIRRIFEPYYTTKQTERNMGLGLYYCWNVMNAHGGRIEVKSREGDGSEFRLYFPAKKYQKKYPKKGKKDANDETHSYIDC